MKAATTLTVDSSPSESSATDPVTHQAASFNPITPKASGMLQKASLSTIGSVLAVTSNPHADANELQELRPLNGKTVRAGPGRFRCCAYSLKSAELSKAHN